MKVAVPLAKNILVPLGITAAASAIGARIQKKVHGSGTTTLIISNEEINDINENCSSFRRFKYSIERNKQKGGFLSMLLGTLGSSLLGNLLSGKRTVRAGEGIVRAGYGSLIKRKL